MFLTQTVLSCYNVRHLLERRFLRKYYGSHWHFVFPVNIKWNNKYQGNYIGYTNSDRSKIIFSINYHNLSNWFFSPTFLFLSFSWSELDILLLISPRIYLLLIIISMSMFSLENQIITTVRKHWWNFVGSC